MSAFATIVVALAVTVPAPDPGAEAKQKLEILKKKMPDVVAKWVKGGGFAGSLRVAKQLDHNTAKLVYLLDQNGARPEGFTIYLSFYNACWSTTHYKATWTDESHCVDLNRAVWLLMLAIDEA